MCVNSHTHPHRQFNDKIAQLNFKFIARIISSVLNFSRFEAKTFLVKSGGSFIGRDFKVFICSCQCSRLQVHFNGASKFICTIEEMSNRNGRKTWREQRDKENELVVTKWKRWWREQRWWKTGTKQCAMNENGNDQTKLQSVFTFLALLVCRFSSLLLFSFLFILLLF